MDPVVKDDSQLAQDQQTTESIDIVEGNSSPVNAIDGQCESSVNILIEVSSTYPS